MTTMTTMTKMTKNNVSECITVSYGDVCGRAKLYPYHEPALYRHHKTRDGRLVWKYVRHLGGARRSVQLATDDAITAAAERGCPYLPEIRQWTPVEESLTDAR